MKKNLLKLLSLMIALLMIGSVALVSCAPDNDTDNAGTDTEGTAPATPDSELEMKIYVLNGTTALGMAQMIEKSNNNSDDMNYSISLFPSADLIVGAITTGECAIAALPTNVAARLYKASSGKLQLLALNTLGVLYLLDTTDSVKEMGDLKGKTVYVPGKGANPEYITSALLEGAGLKVGTDVTVDATTYPSPDALQAAIIAGKAELAVLPEPKVSVVTTKSSNVKVALDLTSEWESIYGENTLVQGCLVVNTKFAAEHPAEISKFLMDYKESVDYVSSGSDDAINTIVNTQILPQAPIAKKALPKCNLCCIMGTEMKPYIGVFFEKLYAFDAESIKAIPDDGFYYIP